MLEHIANCFLIFSNDTFIIPFIIIGYIWLDTKVFSHAIYLILISILLNCALKITFKVPLAPFLHKEWFAFPSGHMQNSFVLYGWLFINNKNYLYNFLITILLFGIGFGLVHFGYHNSFDLLGAVFFGGLLIFLYNLTLKITQLEIKILTLFLSGTFLLIYMVTHHYGDHVWMAYYALIGKLAGDYFLKYQIPQPNVKNKIVATAFCFTTIAIIKKAFAIFNLPVFLSQAQWMIIGFCLPLSIFILNFVTPKGNKQK